MVVSAGELNKPVVFKRPTSSRTAGGELTRTYTAIDSVRARVTKKSQSRAYEVAPAILNTDEVVVRYSSQTKDIDKDWLVTYDGKDHVIHTVDPSKYKNQFIEFLVKANG